MSTTLTDDMTAQNNENKSNSLERPFKYANIDITKIESDNRRLNIYLDGVFDMTHYGHFRLFKKIKDKFPNASVIVGVSGDEETIRLKGQTVMNEVERTESIEFCRYVDKVICPCPWIITQSFIDEQNIDYVAHDGLPYISDNQTDIYDFVKKQGRFIATQRTEGISTTGLINRIICRYNEYVLRNLKRGVKRKELNVSWTRQKRIEMSHQLDTITDNVTKWMDQPNSFVDDFLRVFGADGKILKKVEQQREKILKKVEQQREKILKKVEEQKEKILKKVQQQKEKILNKVEQQKEEILKKVEQQKEDNPTLYKFLNINLLIICIVIVIVAVLLYQIM